MSDDQVVETLKLRKPIKTHGKDGVQEASELHLKLPSGRLMLRLGEPFTTKVEQDGPGAPTRFEFKINPALATEYLVEMSGINAQLLEQLHPLDVRDAFDRIVAVLRPTGA